MRKWVAAFAGGVLVAGLGFFLTAQGLDKADKLASVLGLFVGLIGLGLAVFGGAGARRQVGGQSVTDSTIGGSVTQVRGVRGNLRVGPSAPAGSPVAPPLSAPTAAPPAGGDLGEGQAVTRSSTAGPVRQIDDVGGDAELDQ
jgi:hypothetical protein